MLYDLWLATWESIYHKNDPSNWSNRASVKIVKQHLGRKKNQSMSPGKKMYQMYLIYIQRHCKWKMSISHVGIEMEGSRRTKKNKPTTIETNPHFYSWLSSSDDSVLDFFVFLIDWYISHDHKNRQPGEKDEKKCPQRKAFE